MDEGPKLVYAFDDRDEAELAVDELEHAGFDHENVGFVIRGSDVVQGGMITDVEGAKDGAGALHGAAAGGLVGGLLGAAAAALIPGIGPVLAGGILATAVGGAAAGAATGGIFGALSGLGVSEDEALHYQRVFDEGKALVFVNAGDRGKIAADIAQRHGGYVPPVHH
jgi:hypothetical protein